MSGTERGWSAAWTTAPQRPSAGFAPNWSEDGFADHTIRQTVRLSAGGDALRVRLSNRYGTAPLHISGLTVAATAGGAAIKADTLRQLTVGGEVAVAIPAGTDITTDAVPFVVEAKETLTVTMHLAAPSGPATYHAQALATTHRASGDHRTDADGAAFTDTSGSWYYVSGIDVAGAPGNGIVVFGDSLIDGTGSTPDSDSRFSDLLGQRLAAAGQPRAVLNQGIGGNRITLDSPWLGDRATARFERDVLAQPGISTVVILAGINDIAISEIAETSPFPVLAPYTEVTAEQVIAGLQDMIDRAHAAGLRTVGVTLLPIQGSGFSSPRSEAKRATVNTWIRESGTYDAVIDLAQAMGDALDPAHDSGDHLHPSDAGYQAMASAVDLGLL